jgi:abequosyltransferase
MPVQLSICIATMNRAAYLRETLAGIVRQAVDDLEVVVLDGGSTDETTEVVHAFQSRLRLVYHKQPGPGGVDRDFDAAVSLATGGYIWLMSDDDELRPGALARVLQSVAEGSYSLIIVNAGIWNEHLSTVLTERFIERLEDCRYDIGEDERLFVDTGNYLTFIGGVVMRRALWMQRQREPFYGSLFIHVGVVFQAPLPGPAFLIAEPLVAIRYGNAQWSSRAFEIWMFKWPELIWSFRFDEAAKAAVCPRMPWSRPKTLLLHRAKGGYTLDHYRKFLHQRIHSFVQRTLAAAIAVTPVALANVGSSVVLKLFYPRATVALADLRSSRHRSFSGITRLVASLRRSPSTI